MLLPELVKPILYGELCFKGVILSAEFEAGIVLLSGFKSLNPMFPGKAGYWVWPVPFTIGGFCYRWCRYL